MGPSSDEMERLLVTLQALLVELHAIRKVLSSGLENLATVSSHVT